MSGPPAARARLIGICIIALTGVAYQVLLSRIFSVVLLYHFAFAGISFAMLGMTVGAVKVYLEPKRFAPERFEKEWASAALGFAVSSVLLVPAFLWAPFIVPERLLPTTLVYALLFFTIPFAYSGICVTLTLTKSSQVGRLYAADLIGAALGCLSIVALLYVLDPVTILFLLAALCAFAARLVARDADVKLARNCTILLCVMLIDAAAQGTLYLRGQEHLGVIWAKGSYQQHVLFERWNAFSRVRVVDLPPAQAFGWGFGKRHRQLIKQKFLDIDADAGTVITYFDGRNLKPLSFLTDDVVNAGYMLRPVHSVIIIGMGGGRDVISALYLKVKTIIAIEFNPAVIEAMTHTFADFTGHFTELPQVSLINAEARSWIAQQHPHVDLIQIPLIDTWAATAAGGLSLTENRLYTLEAWKEFLNALNPGGMLVISRWYDHATHRSEFYRLLSLAAESLKAQGVPHTEIRRHIFIFNAGRIVAVVVSSTAFTPAEAARARQRAQEKGFTILASPDFAADEISRTIASGEATPAFYDGLPMNVTAPVDDRPFFFFTTRLTNIFEKKAVSDYDFVSNSALVNLAFLLLGTSAVTAAFVLYPLMKAFGRAQIKGALKGILSDLGFFACIGLGFMLIEISQMQRLTVFLGHPVFGLSVVLFTLLLFGGIGSAAVPSDAGLAGLWKRPFLLCLVLCVIGVLTPFMTEHFAARRTEVRILVSAAMLAPAGFFMGMMFPIGMVRSARLREFQPWFWGINGSASVFASIVSMAISIQYGISATYWTGVGAYVCCLLLASARRT